MQRNPRLARYGAEALSTRGHKMGDSKEFRERAARCLELAAEAANDSIKQTFLTLARHWQALAEELERTKRILDDEQGAVKLDRRPHRRKRAVKAKARKNRVAHSKNSKTTRRISKPKSRANGRAFLGILKDVAAGAAARVRV
jgi:hypothetical protein